MPIVQRQEASGGRWPHISIYIKTDNTAECAAFIISWVFQTRQQDRFDDGVECLPGRNSLHGDNKHPTAQPQEVTQQQLLPWVTRQDTHSIPTSLALTHRTPPPSPRPVKRQTETPPHLLLHLQSSVTFSGGSDAGLCGTCSMQRGGREKWEMGGVNPIWVRMWAAQENKAAARLWPSLPALAH